MVALTFLVSVSLFIYIRRPPDRTGLTPFPSFPGKMTDFTISLSHFRPILVVCTMRTKDAFFIIKKIKKEKFDHELYHFYLKPGIHFH